MISCALQSAQGGRSLGVTCSTVVVRISCATTVGPPQANQRPERAGRGRGSRCVVLESTDNAPQPLAATRENALSQRLAIHLRSARDEG
jgi:hypothetical protein